MTTPLLSHPQRLTNKVAIITGSSSGLGRAISLAYAREGAILVCADLRPGARALSASEEMAVDTHELVRQRGGKAVFLKTDVGDAREMEELVKRCVETWGRVDIMVNNAGISVEARNPNPIHETTEETWDLTMRVNAKSVFLGCKYATAQMLRQEPHQPSGDRGWIINISSIYGLTASQNNSSYCASKGAVTNLTRQVALDYGAHRIHCNAICPGHVRTAIFAETQSHPVHMNALEQRYPFGGIGNPEDIARFAVVLASDDAAWVSGANIAVDGGYTAA